MVSGLGGDSAVIGTAEASRVVSVYSGTTLLGTTTAGLTGAWSYSLTGANITTLGQGSGKSITASQTDAAGNVGTSSAFTLGVDTASPTVAVVGVGVAHAVANALVGFTPTFGKALVGQRRSVV